MQLNSILDGCDGELARVRHQGSRLGEWLDTIGDDASNVLFWAGLGLGARSIEVYGGWLFLSGMVAAGANALAALVNYTELRRRGSGDLAALQPAPAAPPRGAAAWLVRGIGLILKQDFFLFLLLLVALAGYLHQALPAVALGALITLGAAIVRSVSGRRGDSPPARRADP
jgi:phosphatidylglycerophosphate synthase